MQRIAKFEKVSFELFKANMKGLVSEEKMIDAYSNIKLPVRATTGSGGYDFRLTIDITLAPGETILIPTGICSKIEDGWVLMIYPRSGLGFKYRLQLDNTTGVIDQDYYYSSSNNIMVKITNDSKVGFFSRVFNLKKNKDKTIHMKAGERFCQGVFVPFGITEDDEADGIRDGGMNSTGTN